MRKIFASVTTFIDKYHPKRDGKCAVSVKVTYDRKKRYYGTPFTMTVDEYNKAMGERPRGEYKILRGKLDSFTEKAKDITKDIEIFTWEIFEQKYLTRRKNDTIFSGFSDYIDNLDKGGQAGTAEIYTTALNSYKSYIENKDKRFAEITPLFLKKYETWMLDNERSITTVSINMRCLRRIFNVAINVKKIIPKEIYPFSIDQSDEKYVIPDWNEKKQALKLTDIEKVFNYVPKPGAPIERAKDFWIFQYLCGGMNIKDVCRLRYWNIERYEDYLFYERAKVEKKVKKVREVKILLDNQIKAIIKKYAQDRKDSKTYVFPVLWDGISAKEERRLVQQFNHVLNDHLKAMAKDLGIKNLTTSFSRHSYATIMKNAGTDLKFISETMGHSSIKTTEIYFSGFDKVDHEKNKKALTSFIKEK